jgi:hypothetical protein
MMACSTTQLLAGTQVFMLQQLLATSAGMQCKNMLNVQIKNVFSVLSIHASAAALPSRDRVRTDCVVSIKTEAALITLTAVTELLGTVSGLVYPDD